MKEVDGVVIFNGTPHPITFGVDGDTVTVEPDEIISARPIEQVAGTAGDVTFVRTVFEGTDEGREIIARARACGANIVVGSIIAAQAYPGEVVSMTPLPGFERRPPAEKRMNPHKFNVF